MARRAETPLDSKTARLKLAARKQSYFAQVADRITLGYNRSADAAGKWTRRELIGPNKYSERAFGTADDYAAADGVDIFSFVQARAYAAGDGPKPASREPITVNRALDAYFADQATRSAPANVKMAQQTADKWIRPTLGRIRVARLTKEQIEQWRAGLLREDSDDDPDGARRSRNTANRVVKILKAALNHAFASSANNLPSDNEWRKVKAFKNADGARDVHFDAAQVRALIAKAATGSQRFADLIAAGFLTGARYGELIGLRVRDYDAGKAILTIRAGKTGARRCRLSQESVAIFDRLTAGRPSNAVLLQRDDGAAWTRGDQQYRFDRAAKLAKLPEGACFYSLRHSHISRAIESGMPLTMIAEDCGTSLLMIQRNYAHVLASKGRELYEKHAPALRRVK